MTQGLAGQTLGIDGTLGHVTFRRRKLHFLHVMIGLDGPWLLTGNDDDFPALNDLLSAALPSHG
jgi:hypothetical protein